MTCSECNNRAMSEDSLAEHFMLASVFTDKFSTRKDSYTRQLRIPKVV